jgi:hypothetical protein
MTPYAAIGHQAVLEKYRLALADVVAAEQRGTLHIHYLSRNWWRIAVGQHRGCGQPGKTKYHHDQDTAYPPWRKRTVAFGQWLRSNTHDPLLVYGTGYIAGFYAFVEFFDDSGSTCRFF